MRLKRYITEENFMDTISKGKPYFVIEVGASSGWHSIPLKPMPVSKMVKGKDVWLEWAKKKYSKVHTVRAYFKRRKTREIVFSWNQWDGWRLSGVAEASLPPGFEGFSDSEIDPEIEILKTNDSIPNEVQRDTIVKIKNTKWLVFRRYSDYTVWVYKYPSAKRKGYELVSIGNRKYEVWQTSGAGERVKSKPDVSGNLEIVQQTMAS